MKHNWQLIREYYAMVTPKILAQTRNEWGVDPYEWDRGVISLTPIEKWLWHDIRAADLVLYPQYPAEGYFLDFANPVAKVAIECDGEEFHKDQAKDAARDKRLRDAGWHVYRISGKDCRDGVGMEDEWNSKARKFVNMIAEQHHISRNH